MSETKTGANAKKNLSEEAMAVLQHVTLAPQARSAEELANTYAGMQAQNPWPEQTPDQVKSRLKELLAAKLLKEGDDTADGEPVLELTEAAADY